MSNFHKFAKTLPVGKIADQLLLNRHLWGLYPHRTSYPGTAHSDIVDIWIRYPELEDATPESMLHELECVNYQGFFELPAARQAIFKMMRLVDGERLGRCLITKLKPGGQIAPHIDEGDAAQYYDRFHLVIQSNEKSQFICNNEMAIMRDGEIWWFDNKKTHEVINDGNTDRIHLIADIRVSS